MIYTTKAHALGSLPHQLELHAGFLGVERAFRSVGLPLEVIELPETYIPMNALIRVFDVAARVAGERVLGLEVGNCMSPTGFGNWVQYSLQAPTLGQATMRMKS